MFKFIKSIIKSGWKGIYNDKEVQKLFQRYPRFFRFVKNRLTPDERFGLYLTIGVFITLIFAYLFFGLVQDLIGQDPLIQSDLRIINLVQIFRSPFLNSSMLFITYLGRWQIVFLGTIAIGILFFLTKRWRYLITLTTSVGFGQILVWLIKNMAKRPRPSLINALVQEESFSFPSGHSFVAFSFYGLLTYFLFRKVKGKLLKILVALVGFMLIFLIGLSRIYLGAHWPSDVLAGYACGAAWLSIMITALEIRRKFNHRVYKSPYIKKHQVVIAAVILFFAWGIYFTNYFLTHPLKYPPVAAETKIEIQAKDVPENLFINLPRTSEEITGAAMEPINIILIGSRSQVNQVFQEAGWVLTDEITPKSFFKIVLATFLNLPYPEAPGVPSFWNSLPNDFAFEKSTPADSVRERHHIHFWRTQFVLPDGQRVWFCTAHFDKTIKLKSSFIFPTHTIDAAIDKEREQIKSDLEATKEVNKVVSFQIVEPTLGQNQSNDLFFTDGKAYIIYLKP